MRPWKWEFKRDMSVLVNDCFGQNYLKFVEHFAYLSENGSQDLYWDADEAKKISDYFVSCILNDAGYFRTRAERINSRGKKLGTFALSLNRSFDRADDRDLLRAYRHYVRLFESAAYYVLWIRVIIDQGPLRLQRLLAAKTKNLPASLSCLTATGKKSFMVQEEESLLDLARTVRENKKAETLFHKPTDVTLRELPTNLSLWKKVLRHHARFLWTPVGYADEPAWTLLDRVSALKKAVAQNPEDRWTALKTYPQVLEKKQRDFLAASKLDSKTRRLAKALSDCVYYKDYLRGVMNKAQYDSRPLFEQLAKRLGLSLKQVKTFLPDELERALMEKSWNLRIFDRLSHYVCFPKNRKLVFSNGADALALEKEIRNVFEKGVASELKGHGAMEGRVQGTVRIVSNPSSVHRHDHGFVLVTSMTTPDFVPVIKRALAVVTDEGGITCHAAIACRELGVPCVVGTKKATRSFKDGEVICVDGSTGWVRKVRMNRP
ncbi:MAG TPA: PEP-utilizing enzyme [Candidatus Norongarragalinales archaeon]|nr:PEP-utilizing enzyme [Candidatus Norongarragalinales archaeon]